MLDLLIATLEMMGLTFVIGFFVAFIIKMIAFAADSFDFYSSHQKELLRLRRLRKLRQKVELMIRDIPMEDNGLLDDKREEFSILSDCSKEEHDIIARSMDALKRRVQPGSKPGTHRLSRILPRSKHRSVQNQPGRLLLPRRYTHDVPESTRRDAISKKQETLRQISR